MVKGRCPICSNSFEIQATARPCFPFCSERCRLKRMRWIEARTRSPPRNDPDQEDDSLVFEEMDDR